MEVFGDSIVLDWLAFNKVEYNGRRFELVSPGTDYWRYVSPALIHFGLLHLVFNSLWIWEFGSRLELRLGSVFVFNLFLAGAVGGNLLQYWWEGPPFLAAYPVLCTPTWDASGSYPACGPGWFLFLSRRFLPLCGFGC